MTEEQAIMRAQAIAADHNWLWLPPVRAVRRRAFFIGPARWEVRSNADMIGANVRVVIDDASGDVLRQLFLPR